MLRTTGRIYIATAIPKLQTIKEEQEQAELGIAHDGIPISYYTTRVVDKVCEVLGIDITVYPLEDEVQKETNHN